MAKLKVRDPRLIRRKNSIAANKYSRKYIDWHKTIPGVITAVYCKGCGTQIKGLNKDKSLIPFWNYREMTIEFDDGSAHMTPICVKCLTKDKDNLEAIYISDLEELDKQEDGENKEAWDGYLRRVPSKVRPERESKEVK